MESCRVLVVEDNRDLRRFFTQVVTLGGYIAMEAENGKDALSVLKSSPHPDMIILDMMMPVMDGWEFLKRKEEDPSLKDLPVVVCTAAPNRVPPGMRILKKPISMEALLETVSEFCASFH